MTECLPGVTLKTQLVHLTFRSVAPYPQTLRSTGTRLRLFIVKAKVRTVHVCNWILVLCFATLCIKSVQVSCKLGALVFQAPWILKILSL